MALGAKDKAATLEFLPRVVAVCVPITSCGRKTSTFRLPLSMTSDLMEMLTKLDNSACRLALYKGHTNGSH